MNDFYVDPPPAPQPESRQQHAWARTEHEGWTIPQPTVLSEPPEGVVHAARPPWWMLRLMRATSLLMYGTYGLTPVVAKNLVSSTVLLCILWVVDLLAWSGLWNLLLTGTLRSFSPFSVLALLLGTLFATAILYYESSFLSADFSRSSFPRIAVGIRVCSVIAIAFVTSLPIDMYLLETKINTRIHQEKVLEQLPALVRQWDEAKHREAGNTETRAEVDAGSVSQTKTLEQARQQRTTAEETARQLQADVYRAQRQVDLFSASLRNLKPEQQDQVGALTRQLNAARGTLQSAQRAAAQQQSQVAHAKTEENKADIDLTQTTANLNLQVQRAARSDATRYENWISDLWTARPGVTVHERAHAGDDSLTYSGEDAEGHVGVGERLIAMGDVLAGRSPRRPKMSSEDRESLKEMKLATFAEGDPEALAREGTEAASLRSLSWACFGLFTFLPMMILAQKGIFDDETRKYFK